MSAKLITRLSLRAVLITWSNERIYLPESEERQHYVPAAATEGHNITRHLSYAFLPYLTGIPPLWKANSR